MTNHRINYAVVGIFVIAALVSLVAAVAVLTGQTGSTTTYFTTYKNVGGLKFGTQVLYEGYPVGQVEEIAPEEFKGSTRFRIRMAIAEGWRIPADSIAEVSASGLLAAVTINIREGLSAEALAPGSEILPGRPTDIFATLSSVAEEFGDLSENSVKPLLANLDRQVSSFGRVFEEELPAVIDNMKGLTIEVADRAPLILANLEDFTERLHDISREVDNGVRDVMSARNMDSINTALANFDRSARNVAAFTGRIEETRRQIDDILNRVDGLVANNEEDLTKTVEETRFVMQAISRHVDAISYNLEGTSRNMLEFSRQIRQNPGLLLGGSAPNDSGATSPR
jgi:phospholipid/cholesterol/gamma-HCH transport system substrate-binding protein